MSKISKEMKEYILEELTKINQILQSCINTNGNWKINSKKADSINQIQIDLYNNVKRNVIREKDGFTEHT